MRFHHSGADLGSRSWKQMPMSESDISVQAIFYGFAQILQVGYHLPKYRLGKVKSCVATAFLECLEFVALQ